MRFRFALLAAAAAAVVAACGGSSSTNAVHTTSAGGTSSSAPPPATIQTPTATTTTSPATTSTPASTTAAPTPGACRAADLSASFLGGQAATGHGLLGFALRNQGSHTCTTYGYPGILFLSGAGHALPTTPIHTTQDFFGPAPKLPLTVAPGATVSFRLGVTHGAASTAPCTTAYALQVIPPNDTSTLRVAISGGAYECQTATVSPMQKGTSAYP